MNDHANHPPIFDAPASNPYAASSADAPLNAG